MSNKFLLIFFFLLLPAAVIGHDGWIAYNRPILGDVVHAFRLTQVGWLWQNYSADTYQWARENLSDGFWKNFLDPFLSQYSVVIASVPLAIYLIVLFVKKLVGTAQRLAVMGGGHQGNGKGGYAAKGLNKEKGRVKYKRK